MFGSMSTTSPGLGRDEQGRPTMSWPTRPKDTGQEAHNRGGLEDNYGSNLVNKASRDRVWVRYNHNSLDLPCKPYPLSL
jgi:hypothetical protein